jgi:uncharacterized damage-inducible protein DinB
MNDTPTTIDLRYPIGEFVRPPEPLADETRADLIEVIAQTPARLRSAVAGLDDAQLDSPYRPGGWTVRQVVHHVADSHLNSYTRFRLGLTEETPTIRPYDEGAWAMLADASTLPVEVSLVLLDALHARWTFLLRSLSSADWARRIVHPESGEMSLDRLLATYAWHGPHHVGHITSLRDRMGW